MRAAGLATISFLAVLALAPQARAARPARPAGGTCLESGTATLSGFAGPLSHRTGTVTFRGAVFACHTTDGSIHRGSVEGSARVDVDCVPGLRFGGTDTGSYAVTWDNGRTTAVSYVEHVGLPSHPLGHTAGRVTSGEFAGAPTWDYDLDIPDPSICVRPRQIVTATWNGMAGIGVPDPHVEP